MKRIYLDHNATTPLAPLVQKAIVEELSQGPRNPSSVHYFGQEAKKGLLMSRQTIASFFEVKSSEILFTSSGTESLNLLIKGLAPKNPAHLITTDLDHPCVFESMKALQKEGHEVTFLSPGLSGAPTPSELQKAIRKNTCLIVLSAVNSETGVKLDLEGIAKVTKTSSIPLIIDGVALLGKEPFIIPSGVTVMGFSAHKIHGPKGVGFIYLQSGQKLSPLFLGGSQESQMRAGTENLPGIIGLAKAISLLEGNIESFSNKMKKLRDLFEQKLKEKIPALLINGEGERVVNTSNLCFPGVNGESLLIHLDMEGVAASHATACSSGGLEVSRVLLNMGISKNNASCSLRFSFSRMNTEEEILKAAEIIIRACSNAR